MKTTFFTLALILFASSGLFSQFFIGASAGNAFINKDLEDLNGDDFKIDENAFAYKFFGGFGIKFLGIEGGYRDLGKVNTESDQTSIETHVTGWDASLRGKLKLGPIIAFAKAGAFWAKSQNDIGEYSYEENSTNFLWGVGLGLQFNKLGIRAEYEGMGEDNSGLSMLTAGATFTFGGTEEEE